MGSRTPASPPEDVISSQLAYPFRGYVAATTRLRLRTRQVGVTCGAALLLFARRFVLEQIRDIKRLLPRGPATLSGAGA